MQHFKLTLTLQFLSLSTFLFFLLSPFNLLAEGTKSIAPSNQDEAALFVGAGNTGTRGGDYGLFAWKDSDSKLYFNIQNNCEKVYMGFSIPKNDRSFSDVNPVYGGSGIEENLIFRVIDPLGNPINNLSCFGNTTINGEVWQTLNSNTANIPNRAAADNGPTQLGGAAGYNGFELDLSACGLNLTGNYSIEFYTTNTSYDPNTARSGFYIPYFDITVANCTNQGVTGRVWSNNWGIGIKRDGSGSFDRAFNGALFVCSSEGFITKIDFNTNTNTRAIAGNSDQRSGFRAGSFNISFNRQGPGNSGDIFTDRQSVPNVNAPNPLLPVFLNLPDETFCPVQEIGEIKAAANFVTGCPQDRCINVATTQPGQFEIIIEGANGNGVLDQPSERRVIYQITDADKVTNPETAGFIYEACIPWDGKDGNGNVLLEVAITVTGSYFQGIYHFPVYDAEFNDDGFIVETVRPALGRQLLYYDDTKITEASGSTESKDGTNGCVGPCHRWTGEWGNYADKDDNYGNYNTINTWWFASTTAQDFTNNVGQLSPLAITCPADFIGCTNQSIDPSVTGQATTVPDNLNCAFTLDYTDAVLTNNCDEKIIERTWFAYLNDLPNERKTCKQTITLKAPVLANCPTDVVLNCADGSTYNWASPTIAGGCGGTIQQTSGPVSGSIFSKGTTTITYEIVGGCGTTQTCSFTVTVKDAGTLDDLTIICPTVPADATDDCTGESSDPSVTGTPTVVNNSSCPTTLEYADIVTDNGCGAKTIKREWVVYYTNNPTIRKTCSQLIIINAPSLSNCPSDVVLDCGDGNTYSWTLPTINNGCAGTLRQTSGLASGSTFPVGRTTITYEIGDGCVNQVCSFTITVKDAGTLDDLSISCPNVPADVADCNGQSTDPSVTGTPTVINNSSCPTTLEHTDAVTDNGCGTQTIKREWVVYFTNNPAIRKICSQLIIINAPTLSNCPSDVVLECGDGNIYNWNVPTVNGACQGTLRRTSGPASGSIFPVGTTTITYEVGTGCANQTCSFTVTVKGAGNPDDLTIICPTVPADVADCNSQSTDPSVTGTPTVINNSSCPTTLEYTDAVTDNGCGAKTIKREWVVYYTDNPSIRKTCSQLIVINAPTLNNCPTDVVLNCGDGNTHTWNVPTVIGACQGTLRRTSGPASGSTFPVGTTTITYEVGEGCANQVCSFTVTVTEGGLSVACPDDVVLDCEAGQNGATYSWETPTASSCCNSCPEPGLDLTDFVYMGALNGHQYYCSKEKANWAAAKAMTESQGGYLAVINSAEENQMLSSFLNNQSAYIGLHDLQQEGVYQWLNNDPLTYTNWYPGQPNNYGNNQDYTRLLPNGQWDDIAGHYKLEYILEIPCLTVQQCAGPVSGSVFPVGTTEVAYHIKDNCGNEEVCTFNVTVNPCETLADYCDITGKNTSYFWIRHVVLGGINNATGANGGYGDFTNLSTNVQAGSEQTIILSPGYARNKYYVNWRVWIDYNRDGDFNDANEEVFTYRDYNILKIKFRIPQQCAIGLTKMRVSMKYGNPANPCSDFTYGEVEDYTINLTPPTNGLSAITATTRSTNDVEIAVIPHESTAPLKNLLPTEMPALTVFPNPVATNLQVQLSDYQQVDGRLKIYNHLGQVMHQELLSQDDNQQLSIDVNHLPDGMYLLSIESEEAEPIVRKFNKQ